MPAVGPAAALRDGRRSRRDRRLLSREHRDKAMNGASPQRQSGWLVWTAGEGRAVTAVVIVCV